MDRYHQTNPPTELKSAVMGRENSQKKKSVDEAKGGKDDELLSHRDVLLRAIGRCEALEMESKNRRTMWGSNKNQGDSTWHFNYGQEAAYKTMADHLRDTMSSG